MPDQISTFANIRNRHIYVESCLSGSTRRGRLRYVCSCHTFVNTESHDLFIESTSDSPFVPMIAGAIAGAVEHMCMYPVDTVDL